MATSNTTKATADAATVPHEQPRINAFTTASAMALLWKKTSGQMDLNELEWFADGAAEQVGTESHALSDVLESTACMLRNDETTGSFPDSYSTSSLLFNLHNQLSIIAGLADIASEASFLARQARKNTQAA